MNILVIDGQGGRMGAALTEQIKNTFPKAEIIAVGTNSMATAAMLRAGADAAATGENPVIVNSKWADVIVGPIGIISANALLGEITPKMAAAVSESTAKKILLPVSRCAITVVGVQEKTLAEYVHDAVTLLSKISQERDSI
jgi:prephenate dehydrogenase